MTLAARRVMARGPILSLLVGLLLVFLPYFLHLPVWITLVLLVMVAWRYQILDAGWPAPTPVVLLGLVTLAGTGIWLTYGTVLGRDPGTALLLVLLAAKLNESRHRRDGLMLVVMCYFALTAHFFFTQDAGHTVYILAVTVWLTALLAHWQSNQGKALDHLRRIVPLLLRALPLTVALFVFFPRPASPFWSLGQNNERVTGLSDEISPGSYSDLALSDEIAFRAQFEGNLPPFPQRYWRGPVFERFDGRTWTQAPLSFNPNLQSRLRGPVYRYSTTLEPHGRNWLLALETVVEVPFRSSVSGAYQAVSFPVNNQRRVQLASAPEALTGLNELPARRAFNLLLPAEGNPRARELASTWRNLPPEQRLEQALKFYREGRFEYTLTPPIVTGSDALDAFLFDNKQGFCEHFAGSFAFLMRAAGVPTRVVGGYMGGIYNAAGGYLIIQQSDAHAWNEVWLEGRGWVRIDPTAVANPSRLQSSLAALGSNQLNNLGADTWISRLRMQFDALSYLWTQWVIGYDRNKQQQFLDLLGRGTLWFGMALVGVGLLVVLPLVLIRRQRLPRDPLREGFALFERRLAVLGHAHPPAEPVSVFARRVAEAEPTLAPEVLEISETYQNLRYGPVPSQEQVQAFLRRVRSFKPARK